MRMRSSLGVPSHLSLSCIHEFLLISLLHMRHSCAGDVGRLRGAGGMGLRNCGTGGAWLPRGKVQRRPAVEAASGEAKRRRAKVAWGVAGAGAGGCRCLQKLHSRRANEGEQHPVFDSVRPKSFTAFLYSIRDRVPTGLFSFRSINIASSSGSTTLRTILERFQLKT
jgi:hypothetical protein